jgi:uncharacterized membrane protein
VHFPGSVIDVCVVFKLVDSLCIAEAVVLTEPTSNAVRIYLEEHSSLFTWPKDLRLCPRFDCQEKCCQINLSVLIALKSEFYRESSGNEQV